MMISAQNDDDVTAAGKTSAQSLCNPRCNSAAGERCDSRSRSCVCSAGYYNCTSADGPLACARLSSDPMHCGGCDKSCDIDNGEICNRGTCACPPFHSKCDGACVRNSVAFAYDDNNCGFCGNQCSAVGLNLKCSRGKCTCPKPLTQCSANRKTNTAAVCTDLTSDKINCGKCGTLCPAGFVCEKKKCKASCPVSLHPPE